MLTGASGGIGVFIARTLAKKQAIIVGVSRSKESLEKICSELEMVDNKFISISFDISKIEQLPILLEQIYELIGPIDILINNAAIGKFKPFQHCTLEDIQSILETNLVAPMELSRLILPSMINRNSGHIVNIASNSGKIGEAYNSIYSESKAGIIMWTNAIRQELASTNVGVSVVCPGYVSAGMTIDFGLQPPSLANVSRPNDVANAVIQAINKNQGEIILDGVLTRLLFSSLQLLPNFRDSIDRWLGLTNLNRTSLENQIQNDNFTKI